MEPSARVSEGGHREGGSGGVTTLHPKLTEDPMTDERMAPAELLQKSGDGDFLRAVAEALAPKVAAPKRHGCWRLRSPAWAITLIVASPSIGTGIVPSGTPVPGFKVTIPGRSAAAATKPPATTCLRLRFRGAPPASRDARSRPTPPR